MKEKVCVIVGGGKGMGAAVAREMNKRRYRLALMSPSENCEKLANELDGIAVRGKAENAADTQALFDATMEKYGRIDSLLFMLEALQKEICLILLTKIGSKPMKWFCYR